MAANICTKQESILKCPTCLATLTDPRALSCCHLFCQRCIADMKPKPGESTPSLECPVCEQVTAKDDVQPMEGIRELLEVVKSADQIVCNKCQVETPVWRCHDCKENFCDPCHDGHNGYAFLKQHNRERLSANIKAVLDKHVYCSVPDHTGELVKLHCKDCNLLICMLCNGTEHKTHEAVTVSKAIEMLFPTIKENKSKIENIITESGKVLKDTTVKGEEVKKNYEDLEKEIDKKYEEIIGKAGEDRKQAKQQLQNEKEQQFSKTEAFRKRLEVQMQSQKNMVALGDSALTTAQGTSLLQVLQSGLGNSLDTSAKEGAKASKYLHISQIKFTEAALPNENLIGQIWKESTEKTSHWINRSLAGMSKMTATLVKEIESVHTCPKFEKIRDELWFLNDNSNRIDVHSLDGKKLRTVQYESVGQIRSIISLESILCLAATHGLYIVDFNGRVKHKLLEGDICDVSITGDMLYVLDNGASKVHVLHLHEDRKSHTTHSKFTIQNYVPNSWNTIQIAQDNIYIAVRNGNKVVQYSHDGTLKMTFTSCDASVGEQLVFPKLYGVDTAGSVLITRESETHRVVILTANGKWHSLPVTGLTWPHGAFVEDDKLWVYEWSQSVCRQCVFE